jgi:hypothetical protein
MTPTPEHRAKLLALFGRWRTAPTRLKARRRTAFWSAARGINDVELAVAIGRAGLAAIREGLAEGGRGGGFEERTITSSVRLNRNLTLTQKGPPLAPARAGIIL